MICVNFRVSEKRRCFVCIYIFLIVEMFYSFQRCFTLFDLPLYSFPSVGVNRSGIVFDLVCTLLWDDCSNLAEQNIFGNNVGWFQKFVQWKIQINRCGFDYIFKHGNTWMTLHIEEMIYEFNFEFILHNSQNVYNVLHVHMVYLTIFTVVFAMFAHDSVCINPKTWKLHGCTVCRSWSCRTDWWLTSWPLELKPTGKHFFLFTLQLELCRSQYRWNFVLMTLVSIQVVTFWLQVTVLVEEGYGKNAKNRPVQQNMWTHRLEVKQRRKLGKRDLDTMVSNRWISAMFINFFPTACIDMCIMFCSIAHTTHSSVHQVPSTNH